MPFFNAWKVGGALVQALKNGIVLGVHRQNVHVFIACLPHHNLTRHYENLFARNGEIFPRFDCRECRAQTACANDRHQHHVHIGQAGDLAQTSLP